MKSPGSKVTLFGRLRIQEFSDVRVLRSLTFDFFAYITVVMLAYEYIVFKIVRLKYYGTVKWNMRLSFLQI